MSDAAAWYRSSEPAPSVARTLRRVARDVLLSWLPVPDVKGATMVVHSRRTFPAMSRGGLRSDYHGLFSEFQSVLGALAFADAGGAAAVRVEFESPLYVDRDRGPNWWTYYFVEHVMAAARSAASSRELHLDAVVTRYGKYGGFADLVQGRTPYLYPMTFGISRAELHRLSARVALRREILDEVERFRLAHFSAGAYVVGVHYRGTDATQGWTGKLTHYRTSAVPYRIYADEVRRVLEKAAPRTFHVFVATDEADCLEFMQREFGDRAISADDAPRVRSGGQAVHLDRTLPVSGYQKGKSALVDSLLLSSTDYLVKGRSNLSDASLVFSPSLAYSFLPDVPLPRATA
jgi:hypothetical protein